MTNRDFALKNEQFREACERAGIPPTARQASKWRAKIGKAWLFGRTSNNDSAELLKKAS